MNNKKTFLTLLGVISMITPLFAGGILTNTNQSVYFIRNVSRNASLEIDAAYYNPAGLIKLKDGFHFSFTNQSAYQTRVINSNFTPYMLGSGQDSKTFKGTASAPIVPSLQAAYKKGKWVLSGNLAVSGGGGKATFNSGLPMFESAVSLVPGLLKQIGAGLQAQGVPATVDASRYSVSQYMSGSSFIYGAQLGGSYEINKIFSVYGGFRLNIVNNHYEGHLQNLQADITTTGLENLGMQNYVGGMVSPATLLSIPLSKATDQATINSLTMLKKASESGAYLDCKQSGWGVAPIIGFNVNHDKLNIGMKYEFKTSLNVENKTKADDTGVNDTGMFANGVNTAYDIPALLTIGVSYKVHPQVLASIGYNHFFESDAKMENQKNKHINGGTNEYLAGIEYQIDKMFLVSGGVQFTRQGVTDAYQTDLSFVLNSYSVGLGGAVNVAPNVKIHIGYFWTNYSDWEKNTTNYRNSGYDLKDVYSRTNKVFAAGVDFSF